MLKVNSRDIIVVQLRINFSESRDVLIGSVYMPYDSKDLPQKKKELVACAQKRKLELLLGCDVNSYHIR